MNLLHRSTADRYAAAALGLALFPMIAGCTIQGSHHHGLEVIEFEASPDHIDPGDITTLSWDVKGAQACEITRTLITGESATFRVAPHDAATDDPADTAVYNLTCGNRHELVTVSLVVTVGNSGTPSITSLAASPAQVQAGGSSTVSWTSEGATACDLTVTPQYGQGFTASGLPTSSSLTLNALYSNTGVQLVCYNDDGIAAAGLGIGVSSDGQPPPNCDPGAPDCPPTTPPPGCDASTGMCPTPPPGCDSSGANCPTPTPPPECDPKTGMCPTPPPGCDANGGNCPTPPPGCDASGANCPTPTPPPCDPDMDKCPTPTPPPTCDPATEKCPPPPCDATDPSCQPTPTPTPGCDPKGEDCPQPTPEPTPDPGTSPYISSFMAYPDSIALGESTTLVWQAYNVSTCDLITYPSEGDDGSSVTGLPGEYKMQAAPQATTEYVLTCHGRGSDAYAKLVVYVGGPNPTPVPSDTPVISSFIAYPDVVAPGGTTTLVWESQNTKACDLTTYLPDGTSSVDYGLPPSYKVSETLRQTEYFLLACYGNGTAYAKLAVYVTDSK